MQIFDGHIHGFNTKPEPERLLAQMAQVGVSGGCVFSNAPKIPGDMEGTLFGDGTDFETRMQELRDWTQGYEDRLFPILWIHPDEEDVMEKLDIAAQAGVCGFKMICNNFFVYEEKCMKLLRRIAQLGKPVIFHSGILWDGGVSSKYNRPLYWEALREIPGLRFSLAHCSWPWIDECVALYGKFLNAHIRGNSAEMFFDLTPGTPRIYRKELLTKLYTIGYDVGGNMLYGTDSYTYNYPQGWVSSWLETDEEILLELGISKENQQRLYYDNLMRFLGKSSVALVHEVPKQDEIQAWSGDNPETKAVIAQWYEKLRFPKIYDEEFRAALKRIPVSDALTVENFRRDGTDGQRNLLSALYLCQGLAAEYEKRGIPENVLLETLGDIVRWCETWSRLRGQLYLGELNWLKFHLSGKIFQLGRLQFCMGHAHEDIPEAGVKKGDGVLEVHIPNTGALSREECEKSFARAREFFPEYFPEFSWKVFTCHSWLLDETLEQMLPQESNILWFKNLFTPIWQEESDAILGYVFPWRTTRTQVRHCVSQSRLAQAVKKHVLEGGTFYEVLGYFVR